MVDVLLVHYLHNPNIQDVKGSNAIALLEWHLIEFLHEDDWPFELEYFRAITKHKFDDSSVAQHFQRKFIDKRNGIYNNLYLYIRGIESPVEIRRGACKLIPGNDGIMNAAVGSSNYFLQKFNYPNSVEHTFTTCVGGSHRGVMGILDELKTSDNLM